MIGALRGLAATALVLAACVSPEGRPNATLRIELGSPTPTTAPAVTPAAATSAAQTPPAATARATSSPGGVTIKEFAVPAGSGAHDVAPAADGGVWFTAQRSGQLGWLDPRTGQTKMIRLPSGSAPHGVIVGPDGAPWITDGGLNAIVRVDPRTSEVSVYKLSGPSVNLNTAAFQPNGVLWFTGQAGYVGRLDTREGAPQRFVPQTVPAPRGGGPYGIAACPGVYYASLAGSHIARVFLTVGTEGTAPPQQFGAEPIDPPTPDQGARRVWCDAKGNVWVSEWNVGQVARYHPSTGWKEWKLPGARPQAYAVFVDDRDVVWLSEWSASAIVRFDPATETFTSFPHAPGGSVRQLHGRPGEVWGALSALDKLIVLTTR